MPCRINIIDIVKNEKITMYSPAKLKHKNNIPKSIEKIPTNIFIGRNAVCFEISFIPICINAAEMTTEIVVT